MWKQLPMVSLSIAHGIDTRQTSSFSVIVEALQGRDGVEENLCTAHVPLSSHCFLFICQVLHQNIVTVKAGAESYSFIYPSKWHSIRHLLPRKHLSNERMVELFIEMVLV